MFLDLPDVGITLGPTWAAKLDTALTAVDYHDHTTGKGKPINSAAIVIDADLSFHSNNLFALRSLSFTNQGSAITTPGSIYEYGGNFYYTNSAGTPIQLTNGSSIVSAAAYLVEANVSSNIVISSGDTFTFLRVNTSAARTITFPAASSVTAGRFYYVKDITGNASTNNITLIKNGSDKFDGISANRVLAAAYESVMVVSNGVDGWELVYGATQNILQGIFGTSATNTQFIGSTITIQANPSNDITIGSGLDNLNINSAKFDWQSASDVTMTVGNDIIFTSGDDFTFNSGDDFTVNAGSGTIFLNAATGAGTGVWSFSGATFDVTGDATMHAKTHLIGNVQSDGTNIWDGQQTWNGSLFMNGGVVIAHNCYIGSSGSDVFNIQSTSTFDGTVTFTNTVLAYKPISFSGTGRIKHRYAIGANNPGGTTNYSIDDYEYVWTNSISGTQSYQITGTPQAGDVMHFSLVNNQSLSIKGAGAFVVVTLKKDGTTPCWATLLFDGTQWVVAASGVTL